MMTPPMRFRIGVQGALSRQPPRGYARNRPFALLPVLLRATTTASTVGGQSPTSSARAHDGEVSGRKFLHDASSGSTAPFLHAVIGCAHVTAALRRISMVSSGLKEARQAIDRERKRGREQKAPKGQTRPLNRLPGDAASAGRQAAWQRLGLFELTSASPSAEPSTDAPATSSGQQSAWQRLGFFDVTAASTPAKPSTLPTEAPVSVGRQAAWQRLGLFKLALSTSVAHPSGAFGGPALSATSGLGAAAADSVGISVDGPSIAERLEAEDKAEKAAERTAERAAEIDAQRRVLTAVEDELRAQYSRACRPAPPNTRPHPERTPACPPARPPARTHAHTHVGHAYT